MLPVGLCISKCKFPAPELVASTSLDKCVSDSGLAVPIPTLSFVVSMLKTTSSLEFLTWNAVVDSTGVSTEKFPTTLRVSFGLVVLMPTLPVLLSIVTRSTLFVLMPTGIFEPVP